MKILLVQTAFLGDIILSTPLIGALKQRYPESELWIMTTPTGKDLLARDPRVDGIITFDKRRAERGLGGLLRKAREIESHRFDKVYSLHRSWRTSLLLWHAGIPKRVGFNQAKLSFLYTDKRERSSSEHEVLRNLSLLAPEIDLQTIALSLQLSTPGDIELSSSAKQVIHDTPFIAVFPGSAWKTKRWAKEGYREVVQTLDAHGRKVLLLGAESDRALCEEIAAGTNARVLAGQTTLAETMAIVSKASTVLANDSMALHLASAFKRPVVAVFCATSPEFGFGPWMTPSVVVQHSSLSCKPCARHGGNFCPTGTERCMRDIDPRRVILAVESLACLN